MIVIAIDPGPVTSGWVHLVKTGDDIRVAEVHADMPNENLLELLKFNTCALLAIEWIESFGMAVGKDVFETCYWIGRFDRSGDACRIGRKEIKLHLCGTSRATDSNVRQALIDRFGPPGTKKAPGLLYGVTKHAMSAMAVATTYLDKYAGVGNGQNIQTEAKAVQAKAQELDGAGDTVDQRFVPRTKSELRRVRIQAPHLFPISEDDIPF